MLEELVKKNRSYRRFYQEQRISKEELLSFVDLARNTASGANKQPTRYYLSVDEPKNEEIYETLGWAGYYTDWDGPIVGERPAAYIVLVSAKEVNAMHDEGIIAQTILLAAVEKGMGGCMLGNVDRVKLSKVLQLQENMSPKLVIALGYPKEKAYLEEINEGDDIKYYRDKTGGQHIPKICLKDLVTFAQSENQ